MMRVSTSHRYNSVAILLHWFMAFGFLLMLTSGVVMSYIPIEKSLQFHLYQWHKAGGIVLLLAFSLRLMWRIWSEIKRQVPALPTSFAKSERIAAKLGHIGLYGMMLALPLSGWIMVSSSVYGLPTIVFGWFEWPHIPGVSGNQVIEDLAKDAHFYLAILFALMVFIHIAAVIKHVLKDHENLMDRIWWEHISPRRVVPVLAILVVVLAMAIRGTTLSETTTTQQRDVTQKTTSPARHKGVFTIDYDASEMRFSGVHAGNDFSGVLESWEAEIYFDASNLMSSELRATFDVSSAKTGNAMYDGTLSQADWFDVANHPQASFSATAITANDDGSYHAIGDLTIRGITHPVTIAFTLSDASITPVNVLGTTTINRLTYGLGKKSDPDAAWVGQDIVVQFNIMATPQAK